MTAPDRPEKKQQPRRRGQGEGFIYQRKDDRYVGSFRQENGTLTGYTFWESEDAWKAAWPMLVQEAPSGEWEVKPPEVSMRNSAD